MCAMVIEGPNFLAHSRLGESKEGMGRDDGRADSIKDTQCLFSHVQSDSIWPDS
jgi:hypothetical protein